MAELSFTLVALAAGFAVRLYGLPLSAGILARTANTGHRAMLESRRVEPNAA